MGLLAGKYAPLGAGAAGCWVQGVLSLATYKTQSKGKVLRYGPARVLTHYLPVSCWSFAQGIR
jgi:hypothetical protein